MRIARFIFSDDPPFSKPSMKIIYHLSTAQRKSLLIQGQPITLLLPVPPIEIDDPLDWAQTVLPGDFRSLIRSAKEEEALVEPPAARSRLPQTITELIGAIADESSRTWLITVIVIRVTLAPENPRHGAKPPQWPANVTLDGKKLLGE